MIDRRRYRIETGASVSLKEHDAAHTGGYANKKAAVAKLDKDLTSLAALEAVLSAQTAAGVLIVFQGMDTAGKDGAIKHVMSGLNPQGVHVYAFKEPSDEERHHDFM